MIALNRNKSGGLEIINFEKGAYYDLTDSAYIISRTLENKIAIAENNDQNTMLVTLDVLKEILALLKEQEEEEVRNAYERGLSVGRMTK